jgi:hypothetical protein
MPGPHEQGGVTLMVTCVENNWQFWKALHAAILFALLRNSVRRFTIINSCLQMENHETQKT